MRSILISNNGFSANIPADFTINLRLTAGVAKRLDRSRFPEWATHGFLMHSHVGNPASANNGLLMKSNADASIPVADVLDGSWVAVDVSNCFIDLRYVNFLSFVCEVDSLVAICFYAKI